MREQIQSGEQWINELKFSIADGLQLLAEASALAADSQRAVREYAISIHRLRQAGLTDSHLRWLVDKQYVEHLVDSTFPGESERVIRPLSGHTFVKNSCFALTPAGVLFATNIPASSVTNRSKDSLSPDPGRRKGDGYIFRRRMENVDKLLPCQRGRRVTLRGYVYHVLNGGVGRRRLFDKSKDFDAFEDVLGERSSRDRCGLHATTHQFARHSLAKASLKGR